MTQYSLPQPHTHTHDSAMFLPERNTQIHAPRLCNVCEGWGECCHRVYSIASHPPSDALMMIFSFPLSSELKGQSQWWWRSACIGNIYCCRIGNHMSVVYVRLVYSHRPHKTDNYSILWIDTAMHRRALRADENYEHRSDSHRVRLFL